MKRLISLPVALILIFTVATPMLVSRDAKAVDIKSMAVPVSLEFNGTDPNKISHVGVEVKRGWLDHDSFQLDIEITGINGGDRFHGREVVSLSSEDVFDYDGDVARVLIPWVDEDTNHVGENYTVCIQLLVCGKALGESHCLDGFHL